VWRAWGRVRAGSDHCDAVGLPAGLLLGLASPAGRTRSARGAGPTERPPVLWDISRAALARHVKARIMAVSKGMASRSRCDPAPPVNLTVCAPPAHQSSRTLEPSMITSWRGQKSQASAFNAIRRTTPSRLATAATRAGSSAAGSRVRGHQAPFRTSLDANDVGNASRTLTGVDAAPGAGMPRLLSRTDMMSALLPPGPKGGPEPRCADDDVDMDADARNAFSGATLLLFDRTWCSLAGLGDPGSVFSSGRAVGLRRPCPSGRGRGDHQPCCSGSVLCRLGRRAHTLEL
jgi:hypothetical protein